MRAASGTARRGAAPRGAKRLWEPRRSGLASHPRGNPPVPGLAWGTAHPRSPAAGAEVTGAGETFPPGVLTARGEQPVIAPAALSEREKSSTGARGGKLVRTPRMNSCKYHSPTLRIQTSWMQATKRPRMSMSKSSSASSRLPACLSDRLSASCLPAPRAAAPLRSGEPAPRRGRARRPPPRRGRDQRRWVLAGPRLSAWRGLAGAGTGAASAPRTPPSGRAAGERAGACEGARGACACARGSAGVRAAVRAAGVCMCLCARGGGDRALLGGRARVRACV